jgi:hypothetical protein
VLRGGYDSRQHANRKKDKEDNDAGSPIEFHIVGSEFLEL